MKLMVAVPTLDYVHFHFTRSLVGLVQRLERDGIEYEVCFKGGTLVYLARVALAVEAINNGFTHVLWLDADMIFDPDLATRLLSHGKPFVTGLYRSRHSPYLLTVFHDRDGGIKCLDEVPEGLTKVDSCGFGVCLTSVEMLNKLFLKYGHAMFDPTCEFGEDIMFCKRAAERGYELYCDPGPKVGHIGHVVVYPNN